MFPLIVVTIGLIVKKWQQFFESKMAATVIFYFATIHLWRHRYDPNRSPNVFTNFCEDRSNSKEMAAVFRQHITPTLRDILHCLPVRHRITYKIATMTFRCVRGACPAYFTDVCITVEIDARLAKLRSARHGEHIVPPTRTNISAVAVSALLPPPFGTVFHIIPVKVTLVEENSLVV